MSHFVELKLLKIGLTEMLPKACSKVPSANEYAIPGFDQFMNGKSSRGCALYMGYRLNANSCEVLNKTDFEESVWCEFNSPNEESVLLGCTYYIQKWPEFRS